MSRVFPVEAMEEELRVGPADGDGAVAGGVLDVGAVYLEMEGAGASPRGGGADWRVDHEEVRPAELLVLLHGG
jgi:hypothetical protein